MKETLEIQEHAWKLVGIFEVLYLETEDQEWEHIANWLHMSSSILDVNIDSSRYDIAASYCSNVYDFELERSAVWAKHCTELARFNFIWGSLESLIVKIGAASIFGSKVKCGCEILKNKYDKEPIYTYDQFLVKLKQLVNLSSVKLFNQKDFEYFQKNAWIYASEGLFITSKIRNHFAHGSMDISNFPDNVEDVETSNLVAVSSKIVLLTIQMLLLAHFKDNNFTIDEIFIPSELRDEVEQLNINSLIEFIHIPNHEEYII